MSGVTGPNLGLAWGWLDGEDGWGLGGYNPGAALLDTVTHLEVISAALTAPPGSPAEGDRYIPLATATGAWVGKEGNVAVYRDAAWAFYPPKSGWRARNAATSSFIVWTGAAWVAEVGTIPAARNQASLLLQWNSGVLVTNATSYFTFKAPYAGTVDSLDYATGNGSFTVAVKIITTNVTGLSAVAVSSATPANAAATAARTFAAGDKITATITSATSSPTNAFLNLNVTWT